VGERAGVVGAVLAVDSAGFFPNREPPEAPKPVVAVALVVDAGAPNGVDAAVVVVLAPNKLVVAPSAGLAAPKADGAAAGTGGWAALVPNKLVVAPSASLAAPKAEGAAVGTGGWAALAPPNKLGATVEMGG